MTRQRRAARLDSVPVQMREHVAENMKERIYATITLIAVMTALWQTAERHTVGGVVASILGTVTALWLATLIAARVAYRAVYNKSMDRHELGKLLFASSGLFAPVFAPIVFVLLSSAGIMQMKTALMAGMAALILSLFVLSYGASNRIYASVPRAVFISLMETLVGVGVILLKLAVGE